MCRRLLNVPKISRKFVGEWNLFYCATTATKTALGIIQLWFDYFAASFFKALGVHFSREARERDAPVVGEFTPVSLSVYREDQFANLSVL